MLQPEHVQEIKEAHGEDSLMVWTYIIGRIPPGGLKNVVITEQDLNEKRVSRLPTWHSSFTEYICCDFAPSGVDDNVVRRLQVGEELNTERHVVHTAEIVHIKLDMSKPDKSQQIANAVVELLRSWNIPISRMAADSGGNQGPLLDTIERTYGEFGIHRITSEGRPSERVLPGGQSARQRYANRATEITYNVETLARHGQLTGMDDAAMRQISTREVIFDAGKGLELEPKKKWRERNQGKSPDEMDSLAVGCTMLLESGFITPEGYATLKQANAETWAEKAQRLDTRKRRTRAQRIGVPDPLAQWRK